MPVLVEVKLRSGFRGEALLRLLIESSLPSMAEPFAVMVVVVSRLKVMQFPQKNGYSFFQDL
jgi:hypothetical protein